MKTRFRPLLLPLASLAVALCSLTFALAQPVVTDVRKADPPAKGKWTEVKLPDGGTAKLVPRSQLRIKAKGTRMYSLPKLKALEGSIPAPPATFDWTKGDTVAFPILGNDQYGDCYYAAMAHQTQAWNANARSAVTFDRTALVNRYLKLSGGDNGLSDYDVFGQNHNGEFYGGIVGPSGPHKILDHMVIDPNDDAATATAMYYCGGLIYTASLPDSWLGSIKPGMVWDKGVPNDANGHAIVLTGKNEKGNYSLQTWGLSPPVEVTPAGVKSSNPELVACFSLEWFDPQTGKSPTGVHYVDAAAYWQTAGGRQLPPNPFPGPAPTPPIPPAPTPPGPTPAPPVPTGGGFTGTVTYTYANGVLTGIATGKGDPNTALEADLKGAGVNPLIILDVLKLVADLKAKAGRDVVLADILKIVSDFTLANPEPKGEGRIEVQRPEKFARREEPCPFALAP